MALVNDLTRRAALLGAAGTAGTAAGRRFPGQQPPPMSHAYRPPQPGLQPGSKSDFLRARILVIYGSGVTGWFEYTGTPALGNPPVAYSAPAGVTVDPYGNTLPAQGGVVSVRYAGGVTQQLSQMNAGSLFLFGAPPSSYALAGGLSVGAGSDTLSIVPPKFAASPGQPNIQLVPTRPVIALLPGNVGQVLISLTGLTASETTAALEVQGTVAANVGVPIVGGAAETWHTPSAYNTSWAGGPVAGTVQPLAYQKTWEGMLRLTGSVHTSGAGAGATIFTLPSGYFNATEEQRFGVVENNAGVVSASFIEVQTTGAVVINNVPGANVDIYFAAEVRLT